MDEPRKAKFEIVKWEPRRFIGKSIYVRAVMDGIREELPSARICGELWGQRDWIFKALDGLSEHATDDKQDVGLITWEKYDEKNRLFGYTVGRFMKAGTPVPDFMDYIDIPAEYLAKGYVRMDNDEMIEKGGCLIPLSLIMEEELNRQNEYTGTDLFVDAVIYTEPDDEGVSYMGIFTPVQPKTEEQKAEWEAERRGVEESEKMRYVFIEKMNAMATRGEPTEIDLTAMVKNGEFDLNYAGGLMDMTIKSGESSMLTPQKYNLPIKIQLRAKKDGANGTGIQIGYGRGAIIFRHDISVLYIHDLADGRQFNFNECGAIPKDEYIDFEWIIDREFMAVRVNGELRHIGNNFKYVKEFKENPGYNPNEVVNIAAKWGATVTVESLRVTELFKYNISQNPTGIRA